jgi:hypothetical protein
MYRTVLHYASLALPRHAADPTCFRFFRSRRILPLYASASTPIFLLLTMSFFCFLVQPEAMLPIHPTLGQDWDSAPTAIDWPRLREFLRTVRRTARLPDDHRSHDHLNEQKPVELGDSLAARCKEEIARVQKEVEAASGVRVVWGVVDGFLLYWDLVWDISSAVLIVAMLLTSIS